MKIYTTAALLCLFLCVDICVCDQLAYNCEEIYHLGKNSKDEIVLSHDSALSPSSKEFTYLSDFWDQLNTSTGCNISVYLHPGTYVLATSQIVTVQNVLTIQSYEETSEVLVTCQEAVNNGVSSSLQLKFSSSGSPQTLEGSVRLSGIVFQSCAYSIRFDYLVGLEVDNCTFRFATVTSHFD